jgi:hypothetical protein
MKSSLHSILHSDCLWTSKKVRRLLQYFREYDHDYTITNEHFKIYIDRRHHHNNVKYYRFHCSMVNGEMLFDMYAHKGYCYVQMCENNFHYMKIRDYSPFIQLLIEEKDRIEAIQRKAAEHIQTYFSLHRQAYLDALSKTNP